MDQDSSPLYLCDEIKLLRGNRMKLIELIDLVCGLLDELLSEGCISERQMKSIKAKQTPADQNSLLLDVFYRKSLADFRKFLICLKRTRQSFVASLLSKTCEFHPVSDEVKSRFHKHRTVLLEHIDMKTCLLAELIATDCISSRQRGYIESTELREESNARLLNAAFC